MIVEPKIRNNTCLTSHPVGCARNVVEQINYIRSQGTQQGFSRVLIIGSSSGYGLSCRIAAAFGMKAATVGLAFEKPGTETSTGTAGWYNTVAFEREAEKAGIPAFSLNGDAFSDQVKDQAIEIIEKRLGKLDLVIYSLAAPRRRDPVTGQVFWSAIRPLAAPVSTKSLDLIKGEIVETSIEKATGEQVEGTVKVMGGEDWELWLNRLRDAGLLEKGARTVAFSYIGPDITYPFYRDGTLGEAKRHLEATARRLDSRMRADGGRAFVSVNKALITRASAVIPAVPLYVAALYRVMKRKALHEGCIEQSWRLLRDFLSRWHPDVDEEGRIRLDDRELREDVQREVRSIWRVVDNENLTALTDIEGVRDDFYRFFGFRQPTVNYHVDVDMRTWVN